MGGEGVWVRVFLTSTSDGEEWSALRPGTHWTKGLMGPRACLDAVAKRKKDPFTAPVVQTRLTQI
jgi:hypothetical protein